MRWGKIASYRSLACELDALLFLGRVAACHRDFVGPVPPGASGVDLVEAILNKIEADDLFPVHIFCREEIEDAADESDLELVSFVHFGGLDGDEEFENFDEPVKMLLAMHDACVQTRSPWDMGSQYSDETSDWWEANRERYDLPDFGDVDIGSAYANIEALAEPWDGLHAILEWLNADTGNWFVDVPCAYSQDSDLDLEWSAVCIKMLAREYKAARANVFDKISRLSDLCSANPAALGVCVDLALGRPLTNDTYFLTYHEVTHE